jgi:hypothetical protein
MITITIFKATDGTKFRSKEECLKHEKLIERVDKLISKLKPRPKNNNDFCVGIGFIQQDKTMFRSVKVAFLEICKEYINHEWIQQTIDDETVHSSYITWLLCQHRIKPLENGWNRLKCTDSKYREWQQEFFADRPQQHTETYEIT